MGRFDQDYSPEMLRRMRLAGTRKLSTNRKDWYTRTMVTIGLAVLAWLVFLGGPKGLGSALASRGRDKTSSHTATSRKKREAAKKPKPVNDSADTQQEVGPP